MDNGIGQRLKQARQLKKLSQQQAAEKLNMPWRTLSDYERGKTEPRASVLLELANLYGVSGDYLLCMTDIPSKGIDVDKELETLINAYAHMRAEDRTVMVDFAKDLLDHPFRRKRDGVDMGEIDELERRYFALDNASRATLLRLSEDFLGNVWGSAPSVEDPGALGELGALFLELNGDGRHLLLDLADTLIRSSKYK